MAEIARRSLVATLAVAALLALLASLATAAEVTRESYRDAVEPICKVNTEANERILGGVRGMVRAGKLRAAARRFDRAAAALSHTLGQLNPVPRPPGDVVRLDRWLGLIGTEVKLFGKTAAFLDAGKKGQAEGMVVRLEGVASRANNVVVPFEFKYCHLDPSRFT